MIDVLHGFGFIVVFAGLMMIAPVVVYAIEVADPVYPEPLVPVYKKKLVISFVAMITLLLVGSLLLGVSAHE